MTNRFILHSFDKLRTGPSSLRQAQGRLFILILLLAFALRLYQLDFQSVWWDEGHSILMASAPLQEIPTLPGMDVHPPGFFAALHGWMAVAGASEFALRYFSLVFSVMTITLLIRFGRELGGRRAGLWAGLFAALSPFYVAYAQEVRMYAMVTFFAAASVYFLWKIVFGVTRISPPSNSPRWEESQVASPPAGGIEGGRNPLLALILYILATTAALYTHYFTIFLLAFENLVWLVWLIKGWKSNRRNKRLGWWLGSQAAILLLFIPQLLLALRQVTTYANPNLNPPNLLYYVSHNWQAYTLGLTIDSAQAQVWLWILSAILIVGLIISFRQLSIINSCPEQSRRDQLSIIFLLGWLLIPLAFYFIVLQSRPSYEPRYMILITPSLYLLFGAAFSARHWVLNLLGLIVVGIFLLGLNSYFTNPQFFKDDSAGVVEWLAAETTPDDIIYVDVPHPFHYYAGRIPAPTRYLFVDVHTAADTLNREASGKRRLYWITWWGSDTDPRGVIPFLAQKQAGPPRGEKQFRGYKAVWYNLSDRPFSLPADLPPAEVNFDNVLLLDGLAYSNSLSPGEAGWAALHFTQLNPTGVNYKISLRLRTPDGDVMAQVDKPILNDRHFQTAAWPIEDPALNQAVNVYTLPLNDPNYVGPLILEAVVYNAETGDSIAAYGVPTANDDFVSAQIGAVQVGR